MAIRQVLKVSRKTFFNPRAWLGYDSLKEQTQTIGGFIKEAVTVRKPEITETYDEALQRLDLKTQDTQKTARLYFIYAVLFVVLAFLDFIYGLYLIIHHGTFLGLVLALAVCGLLLAQAFRYHFWYFQIRSQRLGCTMKEWRHYLLSTFKRKPHE